MSATPPEGPALRVDMMEGNPAGTGPVQSAFALRLVPAGNFFFKFRNILAPVVFCGMALISRPWIIGGDRRLDRILDGIGIAVALSGQLLRFCVIGFAYIRRGGNKDKKEVYATTLVQEGFFAHCRNPLYVGNMLTLLGLMIIHNGILMYAVCLPFFVFLYESITFAEEDYLRKKFGAEYDDYTRRVPRFWISFKGMRKTLSSMTYDWKKAIRKDFNTTFTYVTTAMGLLVWERIVADGFDATREYLGLMFRLWLLAGLAYLMILVFKKTGLLGRG
jgi:protein-S-isoprenylcysteine O-methyltransferase Ste14